MSSKFLIASNRPWTKGIGERLSKKLSLSFDEAGNQEEFLRLVDENKYARIFVPFWSHIIPLNVLNENECIIFHMTDLPFGRGGSPLQNLIARGIYSSKVCAVRATEILDAGDVYLRREISLEGRAEKIYMEAARLIEEMIEEIITKNPKPVPQVGDPVTFKRRKSNESDLKNLGTLTEVYDYIRMLDAPGYPKAFLETDKLLFEFSHASKSTESIEAKVTIRLKGESK